ncbi:hypothetical protein VOI54_14460 [Tamlana sp. 2201CG12-4]|uniref:hypothetical protein n=1 Tax=Tamlana sp. 2201CG12-4 TaxID=3112582 RepID=UPI002DBC75F5|nr:hypothetical protein [Tamlana sp. 2201CG12-4]MEC3908228.1 hypothetical protein [Tamlana sp. 2201CG12-4]
MNFCSFKTHWKKVLVCVFIIGIILPLILLFNFYRKENLNSEFYWTEATIEEVRIILGQKRKSFFKFEFSDITGQSIVKTQGVVHPELLFVGQNFDIKVSSKSNEILDYKLKGIH